MFVVKIMQKKEDLFYEQRERVPAEKVNEEKTIFKKEKRQTTFFSFVCVSTSSHASRVKWSCLVKEEISV